MMLGGGRSAGWRMVVVWGQVQWLVSLACVIALGEIKSGDLLTRQRGRVGGRWRSSSILITRPGSRRYSSTEFSADAGPGPRTLPPPESANASPREEVGERPPLPLERRPYVRSWRHTQETVQQMQTLQLEGWCSRQPFAESRSTSTRIHIVSMTHHFQRHLLPGPGKIGGVGEGDGEGRRGAVLGAGARAVHHREPQFCPGRLAPCCVTCTVTSAPTQPRRPTLNHSPTHVTSTPSRTRSDAHAHTR
jgi:hypothetical protein